MSFEDELENLQKRMESIESKVVELINNVNTRVLGIESFLQNQNYRPPAYSPPKYPPIKSKEKCEEAGGTWDEETKTCELPKKEKKESYENVAVLPNAESQSLSNISDYGAEEIAIQKFGKERGWKNPLAGDEE